MRSFRFLLSRRWILFALAVVVLAYATWWLGNWQFSRLQDKRQDNDIIRTNEKADPEPARNVMAVGTDLDDADEWRRVTATGTYDTADTIIWRYRSGDHDRNGVDVVVPLVMSDGSTLLVDRGWMSTPDQDTLTTPPNAPSGTVTVVGWARADASGSATSVTAFGDLLGTRALSAVEAGKAIDHPTLGGFVNLDTENGASARGLEKVDMPELNDGPHFFYGIQWWFFGVLGVVGFFYLLYDERRAQQGDDTADPAAGVGGPPADDAQPTAAAVPS
ncbi:MAG: SURF1 family protein, partial [Nocardioides sp.]|uniref:SURF1 family cytochrome oxidase biogenesis protein n=1 Tax=Nocardioides sp. TaxID=35761 RepID=UPI0039E3AF1B